MRGLSALVVLALAAMMSGASAGRVTTWVMGEPSILSFQKGQETCNIDGGPFLCFYNTYIQIYCTFKKVPYSSATYASMAEVYFTDGVSQIHWVRPLEGAHFENGATQIVDSNGNVWLELLTFTSSTYPIAIYIVDRLSGSAVAIYGFQFMGNYLLNIQLETDLTYYLNSLGLLVSGCPSQYLASSSSVARAAVSTATSDLQAMCKNVKGSTTNPNYTDRHALLVCQNDVLYMDPKLVLANMDGIAKTMDFFDQMNRKYFPSRV